MKESVVELRGAGKSFGGKRVFANLNLSLKRGEALAVIGPSGGGKTTLLRCIAGLERLDSGELAVASRAGMVFQDYNLWPHKTVLENVVLPLRLAKKMRGEQALQKALQALRKVGLAGKASAFPETLSGGERQRAAIARTLAAEPDVLLLDEVTSNLDPELVGEVLEVVRALRREGRSMVVVTHNVAFAQEVADRVALLDGGRIVEEGAPREMLSRPKKARTKQFLRRVSSA